MIWFIDLAWIAEQMGLLPCRTFCECAVGPMEISVAPGFKNLCKKMILIEPNQRLAAEASKATGQSVINVAIGFEPGRAQFVDNGGSSFLQGRWSPTPPPDNSRVSEVDVMTFDKLDDGRIDVLALDCEGMEWAVLSKMRSKPKLLTIELWDRNPFHYEITRWLTDRRYVLRFSTGPTTETQVYSLWPY